MNLLAIFAGALGMGTVFLLIPIILRTCKRLTQRSPDLHHTHKSPVPRLGGIALAAAFLVVQLVICLFLPDKGEPQTRWVILGGSLAMFGLGLWDDLRPLGAKRKLLGQVLIAALVCCFGIGIQFFKIPFTTNVIELQGWGVLLTIVWLVAMTNLINLIDGVDGLAGGICLMLMTLLAYVGGQSGGLELIASGMAGALLAFLWFNFPPARIYLGDGGAYFLGFQIGLLSLVGSQKGTIVAALVAPLFVLALPIVDTSLAIARRGLRGLPIFRPDRRHLHHRLLDMGLSRRKVVLWFYGITLIFLVMGFAAFVSRGNLVPALLGIALLILLLCAGQLSFSREWFAVGRIVGNSLEMRREIEYALCLTKWLALEGQRRDSLENLWNDLVLVAQRLGFTSVKLTLEDGTRTWHLPDSSGVPQVSQQGLHGGRYGLLELTGPSADPGMSDSAREEGTEQAQPPKSCLADPRMFELMSELLAEGWLKATKGWIRTHQGLRFASTADHRKKPGKVEPTKAALPTTPRLTEKVKVQLHDHSAA